MRRRSTRSARHLHGCPVSLFPLGQLVGRDRTECGRVSREPDRASGNASGPCSRKQLGASGPNNKARRRCGQFVQIRFDPRGPGERQRHQIHSALLRCSASCAVGVDCGSIARPRSAQGSRRPRCRRSSGPEVPAAQSIRPTGPTCPRMPDREDPDGRCTGRRLDARYRGRRSTGSRRRGTAGRVRTRCRTRSRRTPRPIRRRRSPSYRRPMSIHGRTVIRPSATSGRYCWARVTPAAKYDGSGAGAPYCSGLPPASTTISFSCRSISVAGRVSFASVPYRVKMRESDGTPAANFGRT